MQIHQMATVTGRSSIVYDDPFYVLVLECWSGGQYEACRIVLGTTEPTGADLLLFLNHLNFRKLPWSKAVPEPPPKAKKRYRAEKRKIFKECADFRHIHSMAGLALKRQQAEMLADRKQDAAREREDAKQERFRLRREKQRKRHRGKA